MPRYKMIALTSPTPGNEDEYHRWYQDVHLPEIVSFPGMVSARRFKVAVPLQDPIKYQYLAIYEIDTDDLGQTLGQFGTRQLTQTDASDNANAYTVIVEEIGQEVRHEDVKDRFAG
ncbi:MAG: hypothetical protein JF593_03600 [Novosphingobium sp.]|nr:hypothetical protein [Novosphingobium sp.]